VVLKRGIDGDNALWLWHQLALRGIDSARVSAAITARAADGTVLEQYELTNAWPTKVATQGPVKGEAGVVVNSVTIVCDVITVISPP
jgi:phage tail-like protein